MRKRRSIRCRASRSMKSRSTKEDLKELNFDVELLGINHEHSEGSQNAGTTR